MFPHFQSSVSSHSFSLVFLRLLCLGSFSSCLDRPMSPQFRKVHVWYLHLSRPSYWQAHSHRVEAISSSEQTIILTDALTQSGGNIFIWADHHTDWRTHTEWKERKKKRIRKHVFWNVFFDAFDLSIDPRPRPILYCQLPTDLRLLHYLII